MAKRFATPAWAPPGAADRSTRDRRRDAVSGADRSDSKTCPKARDMQISASEPPRAPMTTGATPAAPPNPVIPDPRRNVPANIFSTFDAAQKAQAARVSSYLSSLQTLVEISSRSGRRQQDKGDFYIRSRQGAFRI